MLDWLLYALVKSFGWVLCRLPVSVCVWLGKGLGELACWLSPKRARIGRQNLKAAFGGRFTPAQRARIIRAVYRNMGAGLIEMLRLPAMDAAYGLRYVEMWPPGAFEQATTSGRPLIWLTGHFGNWELTSIAAALRGRPMLAVAREQANFPRLYGFLLASRESKGCRVVHKGGAMRQLLRALLQGGAVGIVGDQATRQGIWVDFFGRPAQFATGPFELARSTKALISPAFITRVRGPFHRIMIEPSIDVAAIGGEPEAAVRAGAERFAAALAARIEAQPEQWLWMHKRWKHTPQRRVVVLSDGKRGHVKQSLAVVQALKARHHDVREQVIEVRYRHPLTRSVAVAWAWLMPKGLALAGLRLTLTADCFRRVAEAYADIVVSCGASAAPANLLMAAENSAKSVVIMDPAPLPLSRFSLAFVPLHDRVAPRPNVVQTLGALQLSDNGAAEPSAREALRQHPAFRVGCRVADARPHITVLIGGDTPEHQVTPGFAEALLRQVLASCDEADAACLVTTSRRTAPDVERLAARALEPHPRCRALVLAGRDPLEGTMAGLLAWASVVVVTGDSVSMVSEACASGRPVIVVEPPLRRRGRSPKASVFVQALVQQGYARRYQLPEITLGLRRCLASEQPAPRLDTYRAVRDAVARL